MLYKKIAYVFIFLISLNSFCMTHYRYNTQVDITSKTTNITSSQTNQLQTSQIHSHTDSNGITWYKSGVGMQALGSSNYNNLNLGNNNTTNSNVDLNNPNTYFYNDGSQYNPVTKKTFERQTDLENSNICGGSPRQAQVQLEDIPQNDISSIKQIAASSKIDQYYLQRKPMSHALKMPDSEQLDNYRLELAKEHEAKRKISLENSMQFMKLSKEEQQYRYDEARKKQYSALMKVDKLKARITIKYRNGDYEEALSLENELADAQADLNIKIKQHNCIWKLLHEAAKKDNRILGGPTPEETQRYKKIREKYHLGDTIPVVHERNSGKIYIESEMLKKVAAFRREHNLSDDVLVDYERWKGKCYLRDNKEILQENDQIPEINKEETKIILNPQNDCKKLQDELNKLEKSLDNTFIKTVKTYNQKESIEASKLEQEIRKEKREQERRRIEELNSPEKVAKTAEILYKNKKKENRCSDSVSPNSQRHIQSLKKIAKALKKFSDPNTDQKWYEQYQDRVYDVSNIDSNILHALGFDFNEEKLFNASEPQHEMMKTILLHTEGIEAYLAKYSEKESIQRLTNENIEHLKEAIECIKADRLGEALIALEKSWAYQDLTSDACFGHKLLSTSKSLAKGVYFGAKRAINLPQRAVDLYHTAKALGTVFAKLCEIDELMAQGRVREAEEKYEILKQGFVGMWEEMKEKVSNASDDDIVFFFGELIGGGLAAKGLRKSVQHAVRILKPRVIKGMKTCGQKLNKYIEKGKEGFETFKKNTKINPGNRKQATTTNGLVVDVEEQVEKVAKKSNQLLSKRKGKRTGGSKSKCCSKNKGGTGAQKERIVNTITKTEFFKKPEVTEYYESWKKVGDHDIYRLKKHAKKFAKKCLGKNSEYIYWDFRHNDLEVFSKGKVHLGSVDPMTLEFYKPPVPNRPFPRSN